MASVILVNPETMKQQSNEIRRYKQDHIDVMTKITNLVMSLGEVWQGEAQTAFVSKYFSMQNVYTSFENALEEFAVLMDKVATEMTNTDKSGKSTISSIY